MRPIKSFLCESYTTIKCLNYGKQNTFKHKVLVLLKLWKFSTAIDVLLFFHAIHTAMIL